VRQSKTMGFLDKNHIDKIFNAYSNFENEENFAALVSKETVLENKGNMSVSLYVRPEKYDHTKNDDFETVYSDWENSSVRLKKSMSELFQILEN